jgi:hypothetical protein
MFIEMRTYELRPGMIAESATGCEPRRRQQ